MFTGRAPSDPQAHRSERPRQEILAREIPLQDFWPNLLGWLAAYYRPKFLPWSYFSGCFWVLVTPSPFRQVSLPYWPPYWEYFYRPRNTWGVLRSSSYPPPLRQRDAWVWSFWLEAFWWAGQSGTSIWILPRSPGDGLFLTFFLIYFSAVFCFI